MKRHPQIGWLSDGRRLHLQDGPIDLIVEARGSSGRPEREREPDKAAAGMRRLDLPARGLSVEEENNVVTVHWPAR